MDVTSGQISIQPIPQYLVINGSVTLSLTGITDKLELVTWYKGLNKTPSYQILNYIPPISPPLVPGFLYNDRFSAFNYGSLHIKGLRLTDEGNYIVAVQTMTSGQDVYVTLTIYEPVTKPKITASTAQPKENEAFTLTCNTNNAMTIRWTRKGAGVPSGAKLSVDNKTLTFSSVKRGDAGEYRCEAQNLFSTSTSDPYTVTMNYGPDKAQIDGAAFVRPGSSITLTCSADSVPTPEYQWKRNGSDLQEKTNKYSISNAAPEDEGLYTCVVKNPVTLRTATDSVYVNVTAEYTETISNDIGIIIGLIIGTILGGVLIISISVFLYRKILTKKRNESLENRQDHINIYENVTVAQPNEESSYMDLQFRTENTYAELKT
ncbi:cell adhesion molecule CEACAM1-like [Phyllobates terribilis]|uniref:cell adhesion molecule CEACAM1-like n=1 Tax=Phyllobates terribilis TaxID=111132 RepID=UPI003CCAEE62